MKTFSIIAKVVAALAAVAGIVYVVATYGDKIVAWAKKLLKKNDATCCECEDCECNENGECTCDCDCGECECIDCEGGDCEACLGEETAEEEAVDAAEKDFEA